MEGWGYELPPPRRRAAPAPAAGGSPVADFVPERLEIVVVKGQTAEIGAAAQGDGAFEPAAGVVEIAELAGITGQVVRDHAGLGETHRDRQQHRPGLGGAFEFVEGVGLVHPAGRILGRGDHQLRGHRQGLFPLVIRGADAPLRFEDLGVRTGLGREAGQLDPRFAAVAEFQPAVHGVHVVDVRRPEVLHARQSGKSGPALPSGILWRAVRPTPATRSHKALRDPPQRAIHVQTQVTAYAAPRAQQPSRSKLTGLGFSTAPRQGSIAPMNEREPDRREEGGPPPLFDLTRWSIIQRARDESTVALNHLFTQYRQPLLTHLRVRGCGEDQAEDLVQGFCAHLLSRDFLANVAREKGRFRTWLLNALQNYIRDEYAKRKALKRGEGRVPASLDEAREDGTPLLEPAADTTPADREYDRAWAESVLTNALNRLGQDCATTGHKALFQALEPVLFAEETSPSYREIAEQLAMTEGAVKVAAHRIRARLKGLIREEVLQTVANQEDWEEEVRYLISLFSR